MDCTLCVLLESELKSRTEAYGAAVAELRAKMGISANDRYKALKRAVDAARDAALVAIDQCAEHRKAHAEA